MSKSKPTWKRGLQTFAIILILVIFPLVSWYFLQSGFNFTKEKFDKLDSLGQLSLYEFPLQDQKPITLDQMEGSIILAGSLIDIEKESLDIIQGLYKKFDEREDLIFLFYDKEKTDYSRDPLFNEYTLFEDYKQVKIINPLAMTSSEYTSSLNLSKDLQANELALIDTGKEVRGVYDIEAQEKRDLLISHIVFLLPKE
jgi:hypothetical protein